jgi:hypothetical protein
MAAVKVRGARWCKDTPTPRLVVRHYEGTESQLERQRQSSKGYLYPQSVPSRPFEQSTQTDLSSSDSRLLEDNREQRLLLKESKDSC